MPLRKYDRSVTAAADAASIRADGECAVGPHHHQPVLDEGLDGHRRPRRLVGPAGHGRDGVRASAGRRRRRRPDGPAAGPVPDGRSRRRWTGVARCRPSPAAGSGPPSGASHAQRPLRWPDRPGRAGRRRRRGGGPSRPWPRGRAGPGSRPSAAAGGTIRSASSWTAEPVRRLPATARARTRAVLVSTTPDRAVRRRRPGRPGPCRRPPRAEPRGPPGRPEPHPGGGWRWRPRPGAGTLPAGCSRARSTPPITSAIGAPAQAVRRGPASQELLPPGNDPGHLRLGQHDLAHQDGPRVPGVPPRQVPAGPLAPVHDGPPEARHPPRSEIDGTRWPGLAGRHSQMSSP